MASPAELKVRKLKQDIDDVNSRIDRTIPEISNFEREIVRSEQRGDTVLADSQRTTYQRIVAEQERRIAFRNDLQAQLDEAFNELAEEKRAKANAASSQATNTATPTPPDTATTAQEKQRVDDNKSGATAAVVNQSQDPKASSQQNTDSNTGSAPRSEANFSGDQPASNAGASVTGAGVSGNSSNFRSQPTEKTPANKLHDYTSYTYRLTLFFLTVKDFNNLSANPSGFTPRYALISSSGGYTRPTGNTDQDTIRHPDFRTDFFIDGLSIETVVGLNAKNKSSNAIDIKFTITEPYGLSLLDRLLSACEMSEDKNPNYATQPYLLQIDLLASPTDEMLARNKKTDNLIDRKRIAIKIIEMKIKPTATGSTYSISAIPYNHSAFDQTTAPVPVPLQVEAKTVGDFFSNTDDQAQMFTGELEANQERLEAELEKWLKNQPRLSSSYYAFKSPSAAEIEEQKKAIAAKLIYNAGSYTAAYNRYMESVADKAKVTQFAPTKISFAMPKEIADSPIVDGLAQSSDSRYSDPARGVGNTADPDLKSRLVFPINAGTNIIDVIDQVLGKSDYVKDQINTKNKAENNDQENEEYTNGNERAENKPSAKTLKWYKIIPTVELREYDKLRNNFSKIVTYSILPYTAANAYHPNFPKTSGNDVARQVVREYNYAFTGKNQDIIRVDIDFDTAYYTQISTFKNQVARAGSNRFRIPNEIKPDSAEPEDKSTATVVPQTTEVVGYNAKSNSMNTATNPDEKLVGDLKESLYTKARGDNLNIKLQIIGDPDFIKQDDVYYNPRSIEYQQIVSNRGKAPVVKDGPLAGQIIFDSEQVFVKLNIKNAVDIDDKTGITNFQEVLSNGRRTDGSFSGVYKVLTVVSEFNRGQFTQTLDLVRMPDQLPKLSPASNQAVNNESSDYSGRQQTSAAAETVPAGPSSNAATLRQNINQAGSQAGTFIGPGGVT